MRLRINDPEKPWPKKVNFPRFFFSKSYKKPLISPLKFSHNFPIKNSPFNPNEQKIFSGSVNKFYFAPFFNEQSDYHIVRCTRTTSFFNPNFSFVLFTASKIIIFFKISLNHCYSWKNIQILWQIDKFTPQKPH